MRLPEDQAQLLCCRTLAPRRRARCTWSKKCVGQLRWRVTRLGRTYVAGTGAFGKAPVSRASSTFLMSCGTLLALSASALALGVAAPETHGKYAWTTPMIFAWSLITGMGVVGLATDNRDTKVE